MEYISLCYTLRLDIERIYVLNLWHMIQMASREFCVYLFRLRILDYFECGSISYIRIDRFAHFCCFASYHSSNTLSFIYISISSFVGSCSVFHYWTINFALRTFFFVVKLLRNIITGTNNKKKFEAKNKKKIVRTSFLLSFNFL